MALSLQCGPDLQRPAEGGVVWGEEPQASHVRSGDRGPDPPNLGNGGPVTRPLALCVLSTREDQSVCDL